MAAVEDDLDGGAAVGEVGDAGDGGARQRPAERGVDRGRDGGEAADGVGRIQREIEHDAMQVLQRDLLGGAGGAEPVAGAGGGALGADEAGGPLRGPTGQLDRRSAGGLGVAGRGAGGGGVVRIGRCVRRWRVGGWRVVR